MCLSSVQFQRCSRCVLCRIQWKLIIDVPRFAQIILGVHLRKVENLYSSHLRHLLWPAFEKEEGTTTFHNGRGKIFGGERIKSNTKLPNTKSLKYLLLFIVLRYFHLETSSQGNRNQFIDLICTDYIKWNNLMVIKSKCISSFSGYYKRSRCLYLFQIYMLSNSSVIYFTAIYCCNHQCIVFLDFFYFPIAGLFFKSTHTLREKQKQRSNDFCANLYSGHYS